jgi:hypothetical protein
MNPFIILVFAITIEALVEYVKSFSAQDKRAIIIQLGAAAASVFLCFLAGVDLYAALGVSLPVAGTIFTGIFVSRGTNYINDLIGRLRNGGACFEAKEVTIGDKPPNQAA